MTETGILLWIHRQSSPVLDGLFLVSHLLGTMAFCIVLVVGLALWHRRRGERAEAATWIAVGLTTLAVMEVLKAAVGRPRPELWPRLVASGGLAFPSGHALASAALYPLLAWVLARRHPERRAVFWALGLMLPLFIGVGRLYLGVHWPSDVLAGWALGAVESSVAALWLGRRPLRRS